MFVAVKSATTFGDLPDCIGAREKVAYAQFRTLHC